MTDTPRPDACDCPRHAAPPIVAVRIDGAPGDVIVCRACFDGPTGSYPAEDLLTQLDCEAGADASGEPIMCDACGTEIAAPAPTDDERANGPRHARRRQGGR